MSKEKVKHEKDTTERWLLTYADLMNLLLIFFIILYAISQVDSKKFDQLAESLRDAFGPGTTASIMGDGGTQPTLIQLNGAGAATVIPSNMEEKQFAKVMEDIKDIIKDKNLGEKLDVKLEPRGVVISVEEELLFKSGSADIEPNSRSTIEEIGKTLHDKIPGNQIRVEGHTDTDPIRTSLFPSNWELSSARATTVVRLLIDKSGVDPNIISAVGYGEHRPKVPNDSQENKAKNRRVDIVIVSNLYDKAEAGSKPDQLLEETKKSSNTTESTKKKN